MTASIRRPLLQVFEFAHVEEHNALIEVEFFASERALFDEPRDLVPGDAQEFGGPLQRDFALRDLWFFSRSIT
jgi:hypothetical protein